jgi:hypothetical protein
MPAGDSDRPGSPRPDLSDFVGHSGIGSPGEAILVVPAAGPLGERHDAGGVALVSAEGGLTAVVAEAVGQRFTEDAGNLFGVLGPGLVLGGDMHPQGVAAFVAGRA